MKRKTKVTESTIHANTLKEVEQFKALLKRATDLLAPGMRESVKASWKPPKPAEGIDPARNQKPRFLTGSVCSNCEHQPVCPLLHCSEAHKIDHCAILWGATKDPGAREYSILNPKIKLPEKVNQWHSRLAEFNLHHIQ